MSAEQQFSLFDLFREEARTHADSLAQGLLALEADPTNPERLEPLMRAAHSIKGAARIVGLDPAVRLAHGMEDMFVAAQAGKIKIDGQDIDNLLAGTDLLASLAQLDQQSAATWGPDHAASIQAVIDALAVRLALPVASDRGPSPLVAGNAVQTLPADGQASASALAATVTSRHLQLTFPDGPLPGAGENPLFDLFLDEVRIHAASIQTCLLAEPGVAWSHDRLEQVAAALHAIGGAAQLLRVTPLVLWVRRAKEILAKSTIENGLSDDTFRVFWAALELLVELLGTKHADLAGWAEARAEKFADLTAQLKVGNTRPTTEAAASANRLAPVEHAVAATADATAIPAATTQLPAVDQPTSSIAAGAPGAAPNTVAGVVRVSAQSLNRLMGLAGESLVQARWLPPFSAALMELKKHQDRAARLIDDLAQTVSEEDVPGPAKDLVTQARRQISLCRQTLQERATEFDDHTALAEDLNVRLYREALVSRMRPFADGAQGFGRLIRDMARRLDKQATLELVGMNTEVDRDVLEKLEAPLTHLLRNAVDHGIEPPAERRAAGKAEVAQISLSVEHRAGKLVIEISDDGRGVDLPRLREKIVARGLTTAEMVQGMNAAELLEFLFLPGFSTAAAVTEYSGRGVGLDVVQQAVRGIGGTVSIDSRAGVGTVFHLQVPITLSVVRAVLVEIAGEPYALPHHQIARLLRVPRADLQSLEGRQFVMIDGQNVGVVLGAEILGQQESLPEGKDLSLVVLGDGDSLYGVIVDAIGGEQDLVVRPLDPRLGKTPNISAAAVLNDGTPVLIVDVEDCIRSVDRRVQQGALKRCTPPVGNDRPAKQVLVVDDSITVREVERQLLRGQGYTVTVAVDGRDGWNLLRSKPFDLVVTDVDMPRMNGLELVRLIRSEPALRELPVMIVSYKERAEDRLLGLEVGANFYLTKSSFHDNTFVQAVRDLIGEA